MTYNPFKPVLGAAAAVTIFVTIAAICVPVVSMVAGIG